jgi:hypothetical protein
MLKSVQACRAKCRDKILDEFILRLLLQRHAQQLEFLRRFALTDIVDETKITRETDLEVLDCKLVKFAVVQTLHPQRDDRFDFVAFRAQRGDEFSRQILVQQDFHAGCSSF